jgi:hypothetical protein
MPLYTTFSAIRDRLRGKVRFSDQDDVDHDDENYFPKRLALNLIDEAEGQVELHLSPRYTAPFQTDAGAPFAQLPIRPTIQLLKTMAELQACMRILETDFGSGTAMEGDKYTKSLAKRYDELVKQLLAKKQDRGVDSSGWMYPPLPGLKLNYMNNQADDGFMGQVIVASGSPQGGYPATQMNSPSENFWTGFPAGWDHARGCMDDD